MAELKEFDSSAASIAGQARKAGIPLVVVLVPDRTQAAMISMMDEWPKGFDPYKVGNEAAFHHCEPRRNLHRHSSPSSAPYPILNWVTSRSMDIPTPTGHAMIARFLTNKLADAAHSGTERYR